MQPTPQRTANLDARAITVLAHPLRSRILSALRKGGPSTATTLARTLDTNTGATSYHLRKLAEVNLVEETPDGVGKERWWKPTSDRHHFDATAVGDDPDARAAHDWLQRHYFQMASDQYSHWLDTAQDWPLDWQDASGGSDYVLQLTPARAVAMAEEIEAVLEKYRTMPPATDATASRSIMHMVLFPEGTPPS